MLEKCSNISNYTGRRAENPHSGKVERSECLKKMLKIVLFIYLSIYLLTQDNVYIE